MSSNPPEDISPHRSTSLPDEVDLRYLMGSGVPPREILRILAPNLEIPAGSDNSLIFNIILSMLEHPKRKKLPQHNTIEDAVSLIKKSKKIIVLSGAGISTSAGLPDFRSRNGIYRQIHEKHPDLRDPKLMFDINFFRRNPQPFYHFAKALFPGQYKPTVGHQFIKSLEDQDKLLNNYTQNIDTLERQAGIKRVVECHGSFSKATCTSCKYSQDGDYLKKDIFNQRIPICPLCHSSDDGPRDGLGIMKPNIVFFGEALGAGFHDTLDADKTRVDLLIVIGSSLKVRPVALLPIVIPADVPQILINREPLDHFNFDIELYGNCDEIVQEICLRLGGPWKNVCLPETRLLTQRNGPQEVKILPTSLNNQGGVGSAHTRPGPSGDVTGKAEDDSPMDLGTANDSGRQSRSGNENKTSEHDSDWEDVEVIGSEDSSDDEETPPKLDFDIPESSFIFLEPNKYLFHGAEMTPAQFEKRVKAPVRT